MFGSPLIRDLENDPFFSAHAEHMRRMNEMFERPFGGLMMPTAPLMGITAGADQRTRDIERRAGRQRNQELVRQDMFSPFNMFNMFDGLNQQMSQVQQRATQMRSDPRAQVYTHSSFCSYDNRGDGTPKIYQATSSNMQNPGGMRETRKSVRDSETGLEKMSVGRYIGDRGQVVERAHNRRTGDQEENKEFLNLEEEEADHFNREWRERSQRRQEYGQHAIGNRRDRYDGNRYRRHQDRPALEYKEKD